MENHQHAASGAPISRYGIAGRHAIFLGLSLLFAGRFFPLLNPTTHCMTTGDPALASWILQWGSHALVHDPLHLFAGNIFHPYSHSVILAETMASLAVLNIPVRAFTANPWVGYNLLIFLAFYLSAISGAWLAEEITGSRLIGLWGGIFWGFLFFRVHHIGHLQILSFQGIPAAIVCLVRWWKEPAAKTTILLALVFVAQALVSWYLAVILGVTLALVGLVRPVAGRLSWRHVRWGAIGLLLVAAAILPLAAPYARAFDETSVAERKVLTTTFGDAVRPADYLTPPDATLIGHRIPGNRYWIWQENTLYVGYAAIGLALAALAWAKRPGPLRRWTAAGVLLVTGGYVLALGFVSPALGIRLPLHYMARAVPFLAGLRATQRFSLVLYAGVLILSSLGLHAVLVALKPRFGAARRAWAAGAVVAVISMVFLVEVFPVYLPFGTAKAWAPSEPDRAIARYQKGMPRPLVVLHLPIYYFLEPYPMSEAKYMVDSTIHWARILNGFSGGEPPGFRERMRVLNELPGERAVAELRRLGVDVLAVHGREAADRREQIAAYFGVQPWARVVRLSADEFLVLLSR